MVLGSSAVIGALVGLFSYSKATQRKLLKAILSGFLTWTSVIYARSANRSLYGFKRDSAPVEEWAAQYEEDAIEPELRIVDAHHHLWDWRVQPKMAGMGPFMHKVLFNLKPSVLMKTLGSDKRLTETFGARLPFVAPFMGAELTGDISGHGKRGHNVVGTIYMECGWHDASVPKCMMPYGEVDMVAAVNQENPRVCQGIIAHADLSLGADVEPLLKRYKDHPRVKGIRDALACPEDDQLFPHAKIDKAYDAKFREGFALLSKYGLTYDSWHFHNSLEALADLAKEFPNQTIICDHVGFPLGIGKYKKEQVFPEWKDLMVKLAKQPNVFVKIGGLGMRVCGFGFDERPMPPTSDELAAAWAPYVRHTIETFSVNRCIMESNFPMDRISCSYNVLFNALKKCVATYSMEDKRLLFELNALKVYELKL